MNRATKVGLSVGASMALLLVSAPASANIGGSNYNDCTRVEFHAVSRGDSLASVQRKLDGNGHLQLRSGGYQSRQWGRGIYNGWCLIGFQNKRVVDKSYIS